MLELKLIGTRGEYRGLYLELIEEWSQFFRSDNWHAFHPIWIEFEGYWILGGVEFSVIVLGLGVRLRWNYARTEGLDEIERWEAEILKETDTEAQKE